jgi:N6-L-threonylcarbamoyladenine synthase
MKILGIETSCDETAAGVVEDGNRLLSNVVFSSMDLHAAYGGVVPEIAARSHTETIIPVIQQALDEAFVPNAKIEERKEERVKSAVAPVLHPPLHTSHSNLWDQIDGIAVTYGAGLGGSLLVGVMTARTLAITKRKPLYAINHVEGHIYANFLTEIGSRKEKVESRKANSKSFSLLTSRFSLPAAPPQFPILGLIVSGGHSQLVLWRDHFDYTLLGQTHDDAIGEAFDKVAKILGLPYPGGPSISEKALEGEPYAYDLPKARLNSISPALAELRRKEKGERRKKNSSKGSLLTSNSSLLSPHSHSYDFSFSGLKTAVLRAAQTAIGEDHTLPSHKLPERLSERQKANIAASFQRIAVETVVDKTLLACQEFQPKSVAIGGGVAANQELRRQLAERLPIEITYQDPKLMTDNGAMIAALGCFHMKYGRRKADPYSLDIAPSLSM